MKLNEILGTEFPFIQGGMANIATGAFAAAVSNAGAFGLVGAGGMDAEALRREIRTAKENTDKPFGVNLMLMNPHIDDLARVVVEEGVQLVTTGAGNPGKYVPAWKEAGSRSSRWWPPRSWPSAWSATAWTASSPRAPRAAATWGR